jgi:hypothetical protein
VPVIDLPAGQRYGRKRRESLARTQGAPRPVFRGITVCCRTTEKASTPSVQTDG